MNKKAYLLLVTLMLVFVFCGSSAVTAADPTNNTINGTITIKEYNAIKNLANATVTVNASGKVLGSAKTDQNGYYSINFFSNQTKFNVTAFYVGCTPVTNQISLVKGTGSDSNYYNTTNIQLTPKNITVASTGSGLNVYIKEKGSYNNFAGVIKVTYEGKTYTAYCIDIYTPISINDVLLVGGPLPGSTGDIPQSVDWAKVNYIVSHYDSSKNTTTDAKNIEAAAIQCAIWYYTSLEYGKYPGNNTAHPGYYQFMTYNSSYGNPYDGYLQNAVGGSRNTVANRAWQIINEAQSMLYPYTIDLIPNTNKLGNGQSQNLSAMVRDQHGNPISNVTVNFTTSSGTLNATSAITDALGIARVSISNLAQSASTSITASVDGNYSTLLYDDPLNPLQNLIAGNLLPFTLSDTSYITTDVKANVSLSQTVTSPVNVGGTVTYTVTVTNKGPNTATGIVIQDLIPAALSNVVVINSSGTSYNNGVWIIPNLNNGASATLTITGTATAAMAGLNTTNTATRIAQDQYNEESNTTSAVVYTNFLNDVFISPTGSDTTGNGSASNPFKTIATGIYVVSPGGIIHLLNGTYNERGLTISKNMTIVGGSASSTIIDAQKLGRIFNITSGSTVTITNLTLQNGSVTGNGGAISNAGNLTIIGTNLLNNTATGMGGTIYNTGNATINFNRIIGNGTIIASPSGSVNATNNWWGTNADPITKVSGNVNVSRWLVLNESASPSLIKNGGVSTITADLTRDNTGTDTSSQGHIPDGIPISFAGLLGSIGTGTTINGRATANFTAGSKPGIAIVNATMDTQTVNTTVTIGRDDVYVSPSGNDVTGDGSASNPYKTIATSITGLYPGGTIHIANGTYNEHNLVINKNMTIIGNSANSTIINGQQLGGLFNITSGSTVSISGLTLANGSVTGNGGAINNAGNLTIIGTNLLNNIATGTGGTIYNTGNIVMHFNKILGNGTVIASPSGSVDATLNWWVSNTSPSAKVSGNVDVSTWLVLTISASPNTLQTGQVSLITADLQHDNNGVYHNPAAGHVPDGIIITFSSTLGTVSPTTNVVINGSTATNFTATSHSGVAVVNASGSPNVSTDLDILGMDIYVSPTGSDSDGDGTAGNPYATIAKAVQMTLPNGTLHIMPGTFTGDGNFNVNIDKNITIIGSGATSTVIDAVAHGRIFNITDGSTVSITNLTLVNGRVDGDGGAIINAGNLTVTGCDILNNIATGTGTSIYNTGNLGIHFNRIIGDGIVIASPSGSVDATNNWWGSNADPISKVSGNVDVSTWLVLTMSASPNGLKTGQVSLITADLQHDNNGVYYSPNVGHVPDGIVITFSSTLGTVSPITNVMVNGSTTTNFTATSHSGVAVISADDPVVSIDVDILADDIYVSPMGSDLTGDGTISNPYATIAKAVQMTAPDGNVHIMPGTFTGDGNFNVNIDKNINIMGSGASSTVIDAVYNGRIFNITDGSTVSITNLTLVNGLVDGDGGAIINAGNLTVTGCNILNNIATGTGSSIYNTGNLGIHFNRIIGDGIVIASPSGSVDATNNWWGTNADPISKVSGNVDISRWLVLNITTSKTSIPVGGTSLISVDLTHNNLGEDTIGQGHVPNGIIVDFTNTLGIVNPSNIFLTNGAGTSTFNADYPGIAIITSWIDAYSVSTDIMIDSLVNITVDTYAYSKYIDWNYNVAVPFILSVKNNGAADVNGVIVRTQIPVGVEFLSANLRSGTSFNYDPDTRILTWVIDRLPGNVLSVFEYTVINKLTGRVNITSTAQVGAFSQSVNWTVNTPNYTDVEITQNASNYNPVIGDVVDLVIKANNHGPSSTTINIANVLSGLSLISATPSKGSFSNSTGLWTVGTLVNGEIATLTLKVNVNSYSAISSAYRKSSSIFDTNTTNNGQTIYLRVEDPIIIVG